MKGFEFETVRALCRACGWSRAIGATGVKDDRRAVISVRSCPDDCNVVSAKTRYYPAEVSLAEIQSRCLSYRDLQEEAYSLGLYAMLDQFTPLFTERQCPRCRAAGQLSLDQITYIGRPLRY